MKFATQPCSNSCATDHYYATMHKPVETTLILAKENIPALKHLSEVPTWGVLPGRRYQWDKLEVGDTVLFYKRKHFFVKANVIAKVNNTSLSQKLWGRNYDEELWEFMYFLTPIENIDIPIDLFNRNMKRSPNAAIQSFQVFHENFNSQFVATLEGREYFI